LSRRFELVRAGGGGCVLLEKCAEFFVQFCCFGPEEDEAESPEGYQNKLEQKEKALFTRGEPTWL
jgi:hypothetical protein